MTKQWYELKDYVEEQINSDRCLFPNFIQGFILVRSKMIELESKYACESLKEAGY